MADALDPDRASPPPAPKGAMGVIFLIVFMDLLGFGIIIPLLPRYVGEDFAQHPMKVTLLFSVYSIFQFIGSPVLGLLSDRYGRKPVLVLSQLGSAAGYLLLAFATQWPWAPAVMLALVYASRVIDGFTGGNISTAQAYVSDVTTPENRAKGMGVLGAAFGLGFTAGPALGGIVGHYWLSGPGYIAAALSVLAAVMTYVRLPETRRGHAANGRPAAGHATAGNALANDAGAWLHPRRFLPIVRRPVLFQLMLLSTLSMAAFVMMEATVTMFLATTFGYDAKQVGWFFAFVGLVIIIVQGGLIGRLTKKFGEWPLSIAGPLLVAAGMAAYAATAWHAALGVLLLAGALNAVGRSFQQPTISSLISKFSDPREQGTVFGLQHGLWSMARVVGPLLAGATWHLFRHTGPFLTAGVMTLIAALWTVALRQPAPRSEEPDPGAMAQASLEVS